MIEFQKGHSTMRKLVLLAVAAVAMATGCKAPNTPEPSDSVAVWADRCIQRIHDCDGDIVVYRGGSMMMIGHHSAPSFSDVRIVLEAWKRSGRLGEIVNVVRPDVGDPILYQSAALEVYSRK